MITIFDTCFINCCQISVDSDGRIVFPSSKCEKCQYHHEKIVFGCDNKKLDFEEFCNIFKYLKSTHLKVNIIKDQSSSREIACLNVSNSVFRKKYSLILFLKFCIRNNIYKNWCVKELRKILEERFDNYET